MGRMRFVCPRRGPLVTGAIEYAYLAGPDGIPWRGRCRWCGDPAHESESGELVVERATAESGNFYVPWLVDGHGELLLSTASLMERPQPYNLPVELARGTLNRLRNQLSDWELIGLSVPDGLRAAVRSAAGDFSRVVVNASEGQSAALSERSLRASLDASERLVQEYIDQTLAARRREAGPLPTLLGGALPDRALSNAESDLAVRGWNAALVRSPWRIIESGPGKFRWDTVEQQVQWCRGQGLRIIAGPLLEFSKSALPDWLYLWEEDFEQLQNHIRQYLQTVVERYRGKVHVWHCAAGVNVEGALSISEEQRLRLVVAGIDAVRRADPHTPILVSFDQPWAEYLATSRQELPPLHFADSLIRADLGIAGLGLELNIGYWPGGSLPRDRLEVSRQLDRWSLLGMPLVLFITLPSGRESTQRSQVPVMFWSDQTPAPSPESQRRHAERLCPLLLAKPYVQGLFWNQFSDEEGSQFAHGGLCDSAGQPKAVWDVLTGLRTAHFA